MMNYSTPYQALKDAISRYNDGQDIPDQLPDIPFHGLRHASATLLISTKQDVATARPCPYQCYSWYLHSCFGGKWAFCVRCAGGIVGKIARRYPNRYLSLSSPHIETIKKKPCNHCGYRVSSWSCWADSNRRPHPYQEIFGVFYNNFRLFLVFSIPNNIVSRTFAKCSLRCFHACLWWKLWSTCDLCRQRLRKSHRLSATDNTAVSSKVDIVIRRLVSQFDTNLFAKTGVIAHSYFGPL